MVGVCIYIRPDLHFRLQVYFSNCSPISNIFMYGCIYVKLFLCPDCARFEADLDTHKETLNAYTEKIEPDSSMERFHPCVFWLTKFPGT